MVRICFEVCAVSVAAMPQGGEVKKGSSGILILYTDANTRVFAQILNPNCALENTIVLLVLSGATKELWGTLSPPSYTTTTLRNHSHLRAPTRNHALSMS